MSNFVETFIQGKQGRNVGISTGIASLDAAIYGIQRKMTIGIAAAPKVGKTTLADFACVLSPYLEIEAKEKARYAALSEEDKKAYDDAYLEYNLAVSVVESPEEKRKLQLNVEKRVNSLWKNIEWIYFSFEIDRVNKEFKYASFFMAHDFGIHNFIFKGKVYSMCPDYLMGKMIHKNTDGTTEMIPIDPDHEEKLKKLYLSRIVPIFGEYDSKGKLIRPGKIIFIEEPENPTGLNKYLLHYADLHGKFDHEKFIVREEGKEVKRERISGYKANNPDKFTIIITDHIRKLRKERGFEMKQTIDKWLEYGTFLRNICHFTFIHVVHSNRQLANVDRLRFAGEFIFPTGDDTKDSGNVSEEVTVLLTMMNPNDEKYNLEKHFGVELKDYPNYRSIHVVESRNTECPQHIQLNMVGGTNMFYPLNGYGD